MSVTVFACREHYKNWWNSICRQGDPIRRPNLAQDAFEAGFAAGVAHSVKPMKEGANQ